MGLISRVSSRTYRFKVIMASAAIRRLLAEYKHIQENPIDGIVCGPKSDTNFFEWECLVMGPADTPFEFGLFPATLSFPKDYPMSPPKMTFHTISLLHPNIYSNGKVCISILHAPGNDPLGYESAAERWSPVQNIEKILISAVSMLAEPNPESAANVDAAVMWRDDREKFEQKARDCAAKSLEPGVIKL